MPALDLVCIGWVGVTICVLEFLALMGTGNDGGWEELTGILRGVVLGNDKCGEVVDWLVVGWKWETKDIWFLVGDRVEEGK